MTLFKRAEYLKPADLREAQELNRAASYFTLAASLIAANTMQIAGGKAETVKWKTIARLITERKNEYLPGALVRAGLTPGMSATVNLETGRITEVPSDQMPQSEPVK
jgi:hypothetical protein